MQNISAYSVYICFMIIGMKSKQVLQCLSHCLWFSKLHCTFFFCLTNTMLWINEEASSSRAVCVFYIDLMIFLWVRTQFNQSFFFISQSTVWSREIIQAPRKLRFIYYHIFHFIVQGLVLRSRARCHILVNSSSLGAHCIIAFPSLNFPRNKNNPSPLRTPHFFGITIVSVYLRGVKTFELLSW